MSQPLIETKETVEKIAKHIEQDALMAQLKNINRLVEQNQNKIWLRTKSGKPIAEKLQTTAAETLEKLGSGSEEIASLITELEDIAKEIDEESARRSMIVT